MNSVATFWQEVSRSSAPKSMLRIASRARMRDMSKYIIDRMCIAARLRGADVFLSSLTYCEFVCFDIHLGRV